MKFLSGLLFSLARAHESAVLDGREGEIELGSELSPVLVVPFPQRRLAIFDTAATQRESWMNTAQITLAPSSAATSITVGTFSRGLWEWFFQLDSISDYTGAISGAAGDSAVVELFDDVGDLQPIARTFTAANNPQHLNQLYRVLFPVDGWNLRFRMTATGVGQNQRGTLFAFANRLL